MDDVVDYLKNYIWKNGFEKLSEDPFAVYKSMGDIDARTARLVLITLMSKTHEKARRGCSDAELINHIQTEHYVNRKTAKELAFMYLELFSEGNRKQWNDAKDAGFEEFCKKEWTVEWHGHCLWYTKRGGSYPCFAEATLTIAVEDKDSLREHLSSELKANPFLTATDIYHVLTKQIKEDLDNDMGEYCGADDYYEPYFDEFVGEGTYDSEQKWVSWGLEVLESTSSGYVDYKP